MAKNTTPYFHSGARQTGTTANATVDLTTSLADIVAGVADGTDVTSFVVVNNAASQKTLTISDKDDKTLAVIAIPASAGIAVGIPAVDVVQNGSLRMTEEGPFGLVFHLKDTSSKLRAKVDSVAGGTLTVHFRAFDYTA